MARSDANGTPIGRKLKALRGGLTQKQAAERAGITKEAWQLIESGKTQTPAPKTLQGISTAFGIDLDELHAFVDRLPTVDRFTDMELDRLAVRLAPFVADRIIDHIDRQGIQSKR